MMIRVHYSDSDVILTSKWPQFCSQYKQEQNNDKFNSFLQHLSLLFSTSTSAGYNHCKSRAAVTLILPSVYYQQSSHLNFDLTMRTDETRYSTISVICRIRKQTSDKIKDTLKLPHVWILSDLLIKTHRQISFYYEISKYNCLTLDLLNDMQDFCIFKWNFKHVTRYWTSYYYLIHQP